jgi:hypothetical protein
MAMKTFCVDRYKIEHFAIGDKQVNRISCECGESGAGVINFYKNGQIPQSTMGCSKHFSLNYENDRYQEIIETLRYEKPVCIIVAWDVKNIITTGYITTNLEPIGEQEGQGMSA